MARRRKQVEDEAPEVEEFTEVQLVIADDKLEIQWWMENGTRWTDKLRKGDRIKLPPGEVMLVLA